MKIRDSRLYRRSHSTFEAYYKERWEFKHSYVNYLIHSQKVIENLKTSTTVELLPTSERQTRPLIKLEPDQQKEAWKKAVEIAPDGKVTATIVSKVVKEMTNKSTEKNAQRLGTATTSRLHPHE